MLESFWKVIKSIFISKSKFDSFKNPFSVSSLSEIHFRHGIIIPLVQTKKQIFLAMAAVQAAENYEDE